MNKDYDLGKRTTAFAKDVIRLCRQLPNDPINYRLIGQVVGAAGSIGANFREANDSLGPKDFLMRLKIARRETKECVHWLELLQEANMSQGSHITPLIQENVEIKNILSAIIIKREKPHPAE